MRYLELSEILYLHYTSIREFGGKDGIIDLGLIESAVQRPQITFEGKELYKNIHEKAAALVESLVKNHGFADGNKRVAAYALCMFLKLNGYEIKTKKLELSFFILGIAEGKLRFHSIVRWIKTHSAKISGNSVI
ncbi:MAG: type II toxin-antitoxin system death-on-curing family toxin [Planctomycetes bacterium]|nr:type II toxin-antitoxin system death-on-curing family toxin [Planctomycetota bacterium]